MVRCPADLHSQTDDEDDDDDDSKVAYAVGGGATLISGWLLKELIAVRRLIDALPAPRRGDEDDDVAKASAAATGAF